MEDIVIFKNDRIGDLMHAIDSIYKVIKENENKTIHIFMSEFNYELKKLLTFKNTRIYKISNTLSLKDKIFLIYFFFTKNISKTIILKPALFYFILPLIFFYKKINFSAICLINKNYHRPSIFLRKYLSNYVINDRGTTNVRKSISELHNDLIKNYSKKFKPKEIPLNKNLLNFLPKKYIFFHFNYFKFNERGWGINELYLIIDSLKVYNKKIVISNDINDVKTNLLLKKKFSFFENNQSNLIDNNIFYLPNIKGEDFYNTIKNSMLVIAFHGSITSIAAINDVPVLDIFHTIIKNKTDFLRYKNSFHEFKFKKHNYEFIVPSLDIYKTIKKIIYMISYGRKISNKII